MLAGQKETALQDRVQRAGRTGPWRAKSREGIYWIGSTIAQWIALCNTLPQYLCHLLPAHHLRLRRWPIAQFHSQCESTAQRVAVVYQNAVGKELMCVFNS